MSSARFQVSGPAIRKSGIVFQQGQRLTRFSRESGQVRRKQTRRGLRFLSLTLALYSLPLSLLQGQKPSGNACFLWNNF